MVRGKPILKKFLKVYRPGPYTIKLVWYPWGVIKFAAAAKATTKINGIGFKSKLDAKVSEMGNISATAALLVIYAAKMVVSK